MHKENFVVVPIWAIIFFIVLSTPAIIIISTLLLATSIGHKKLITFSIGNYHADNFRHRNYRDLL